MWINNVPGHSCILHSFISLDCPLHVPPFSSLTSFVRMLVLVPIPHVFEHSPTFQASQMQLIAKNTEDKLCRESAF